MTIGWSWKSVKDRSTTDNHGQLPEADAESVYVKHLSSPTSHDCEWLATLFDDYREHYSESASTPEAARWLEENLTHDRLSAFVATVNGDLVGFALIAVTPASLRLGHFWQIRDLFVSPPYRQRGIGGRLLEAIGDAAAASGALRVSLQTESDNHTALRLYMRHGFSVVEGYRSLSLDMPVDSPDH